MTAVVASRERLDGVEVVVQVPDRRAEEEAYLQDTVRQSDAQMEEAQQRLLELLPHLQHRLGYTKRTAIAREVAQQEGTQQLEQEGHFPQAHSACDHGVLPVDVTRATERVGKHWVRARQPLVSGPGP